MRSIPGCLFLLLAFLLSACTTGDATRTLEPQLYSLAQGTPVVVEIESGALLLTNGGADQVELSSQLPIASQAEITATTSLDSLHILIKDQGEAQLSLRLPPGTSISLETFAADLILLDFSGEVRIDSTAGDILLQDCTGRFVVVANRGNASFQSCQGEVTLFGNYGYLSLVDVSGVISASTIMGAIHYEGRVAATDQVFLETDHGPVAVWLDSASDASVRVTTTSGVVDCVIPGLEPAGAGCAGVLGNHLGVLEIRSVSGDVDLQRLP
jgi:hypothetical protein